MQLLGKQMMKEIQTEKGEGLRAVGTQVGLCASAALALYLVAFAYLQSVASESNPGLTATKILVLVFLFLASNAAQILIVIRSDRSGSFSVLLTNFEIWLLFFVLLSIDAITVHPGLAKDVVTTVSGTAGFFAGQFALLGLPLVLLNTHIGAIAPTREVLSMRDSCASFPIISSSERIYPKGESSCHADPVVSAFPLPAVVGTGVVTYQMPWNKRLKLNANRKSELLAGLLTHSKQRTEPISNRKKIRFWGAKVAARKTKYLYPKGLRILYLLRRTFAIPGLQRQTSEGCTASTAQTAGLVIT